MGLLATTLARLVPEVKANIGASIPTWESGVPQYSQVPGQGNYLALARDGYNANDIVFAAVEELATSAAEPRIALYQRAAKGPPEKLTAHPLLDLFEQPNPFTDRYTFIAAITMFLAVAGNAYIHKERSAAGKLVELWLLRPDRVRVIPDARTHIGGYDYCLGDHHYLLPARDVIHCRTRSLTDDYYGLPPLAVVARRVDIDNAMTAFTRAFFHNAGVPAGLLTITKQVSEAERQLMVSRFRAEYGGPGNAHKLLVLDNTEAQYTPMGLPLGERGLVLPALDEISEARIARVFGVPLELIGARLSMRGQRSAAREARAGFWDETLVPYYRLLGAQLHTGLAGEPGYDGYDFLDFDLTTVQALQEDADALMQRAVRGYSQGVLKRSEARRMVGQDATADDEVYFMPRSAGLLDPDETLVPGAAAPELVGTPPVAVPVPTNGATNGAVHG